MSIKKINRSFQFTLPKGFRKKFDLNEGDYLEVTEEKDYLVVRPVEIVRKSASDSLNKVLKKSSKHEWSSLSEKEILKRVNEEIKKNRFSKRKKTSTASK